MTPQPTKLTRARNWLHEPRWSTVDAFLFVAYSILIRAFIGWIW